MSPTYFIPCSITLTEKEYNIVQDLARTLAPSDYAFSAAIRQIIAEWKAGRSAVSQKQKDASIRPRAKDG